MTRAALGDLLALLVCPHCGAGLAEARLAGSRDAAAAGAQPGGAAAGAIRCANGHAFDRARQGYVNLRTGRPGAAIGDTAEMVAARERFLAAGHYDALRDAVVTAAVHALAHDPPGCLVDTGAGTGWYLRAVLDRLPGRAGLALDVSRYALRRAARAHARAAAVGCDLWQGLPLRDGVAALALDVFAPRNAAEVARVLHPAGRLLVAAPTPRHLDELVGSLGLVSVDARKQERLDAGLGEHFVGERRTVHEQVMDLRHADVVALVTMGPSAWHHDAGRLRERVAALGEPVAVRSSVALSTYRPRR